MKKIILILLISFVYAVFTNAQIDSAILQKQTASDNFNSRELYLKKSKHNETAGCILLVLGTALIIKGIDKNNHPNGWLDFTGPFLIMGGTLSTLISIPFFITSAHKARKAAQF